MSSANLTMAPSRRSRRYVSTDWSAECSATFSKMPETARPVGSPRSFSSGGRSPIECTGRHASCGMGSESTRTFSRASIRPCATRRTSCASAPPSSARRAETARAIVRRAGTQCWSAVDMDAVSIEAGIAGDPRQSSGSTGCQTRSWATGCPAGGRGVPGTPCTQPDRGPSAGHSVADTPPFSGTGPGASSSDAMCPHAALSLARAIPLRDGVASATVPARVPDCRYGTSRRRAATRP